MDILEADKLIQLNNSGPKTGTPNAEGPRPLNELKEFKQNCQDQIGRQKAWYAIITVGYFTEVFLSIILLVAGMGFSFIDPINLDWKVAYQIVLGSLSLAIILEVISLLAPRSVPQLSKE